MAKKAVAKPETEGLEPIAVQLDALAVEAAKLDDKASKAIARAAKSCRWFEAQRATRLRRVGSLVATMKEKGLSDSEIVAALTR
jgi:hypothetical protein